MGSIGLFSRMDLTEAVKKKKPVSQKDIDVRVAGELSPEAANALVRTPTPPYIQKNAAFLVIGRQADSEDIPLTGKIHQICYELDFAKIPYALDSLIRSKHLPTTTAKVLAAALAQNIKDTVRKTKPRVVLALSADIAQIFLPQLASTVIDIRGQVYPAHVGDHDFWLVVTHDPRDITLDEYGRPPPWADAILYDTRLAIQKWKEKSKPDTTYMRADPAYLRSFGKFESRKSHRVKALWKFAETAGGLICLDYETRPLFPWLDVKARITAIALSDGNQTLSVPFDHKLFVGADDRDELIEAFKACLKGRIVVAHNVLFELYWTFWVFGKDVVFSVKRWECTQVGAFVYHVRAASKSMNDDEPGVTGTSLDDQTVLHFGVSVKGLSPKDSWNEDTVSLDEHLNYNALDTYFGWLLHQAQQNVLIERGLDGVYRFRLKRSLFLAWSSVRGMPVDVDCVAEFWEEICTKEGEAKAALMSHPDVLAYTRKYGQFETTPEATGRLLTKICGAELGLTAKGKISTTKDALIAHAEEHPVARLVVTLREAEKQKSTYLDKWRPGVKDSYVGIDGKTHPQRTPTRAVTGRHSSQAPNAQNVPARGYWKKIRKIVRARPGWKIVSIDMGQIEARIIAIASGDKNFTASLRGKGLDVHMDWAKRLEVFDEDWQLNHGVEPGRLIKLRDRHKADLKGLRSIVKNKWVFPAFFGAGAKKTSEGMLIDKELADYVLRNHFWVEFAGVKEWHKRLEKFYKKHFYVESMTGFRIYGPLTYNNIINYGIQNTASEILQDGAGKITRLAYKLGLAWLVPIIDIHDDLTFHVPDEHVEWLVQTVVPIMLHPSFDFITVPLTCEVKVGDDWATMTEIGVYSSEQDQIIVNRNQQHAH
jgi:hypothetical protein